MSRASKNKRRRARQRRKHQQQRQTALQLTPIRKVSTAELFAEIQRRAEALTEIFGGSQQI
jgi:hypothetical protein